MIVTIIIILKFTLTMIITKENEVLTFIILKFTLLMIIIKATLRLHFLKPFTKEEVVVELANFNYCHPSTDHF